MESGRGRYMFHRHTTLTSSRDCALSVPVSWPLSLFITLRCDSHVQPISSIREGGNYSHRA